MLPTSAVFSNHIQNSISFFASNNTHEIDIASAYQRLTGTEQHKLQNNIITILQKFHIEQGHFENILGMYRMSNNQHMTADNTEHFTSSPYQHLSNKMVFEIAKILALTLKQDSVAVFIPTKQVTMGDISVIFSSAPTISEITTLVHDKLPASYSQAFSLHIADAHADFTNARVTEIEWLGSKLKFSEIKAAFPNDKISLHSGTVFLVYRNGHKQRL